MKKTNNKYRNNSNQIYSLNYKFDSISIAGKISGTALDLIKKYNELAKEAHANNDYVTAEIFRQYAEHYRKIVTEINEKKNAQKVIAFQKNNESHADNDDNLVSNDNLDEVSQDLLCNNDKEDGQSSIEICVTTDASAVENKTGSEKKEFKVIEISSVEADSLTEAKTLVSKPRTRRVVRKKDVAI